MADGIPDDFGLTLTSYVEEHDLGIGPHAQRLQHHQRQHQLMENQEFELPLHPAAASRNSSGAVKQHDSDGEDTLLARPDVATSANTVQVHPPSQACRAAGSEPQTFTASTASAALAPVSDQLSDTSCVHRDTQAVDVTAFISAECSAPLPLILMPDADENDASEGQMVEGGPMALYQSDVADEDIPYHRPAHWAMKRPSRLPVPQASSDDDDEEGVGEPSTIPRNHNRVRKRGKRKREKAGRQNARAPLRCTPSCKCLLASLVVVCALAVATTAMHIAAGTQSAVVQQADSGFTPPPSASMVHSSPLTTFLPIPALPPSHIKAVVASQVPPESPPSPLSLRSPPRLPPPRLPPCPPPGVPPQRPPPLMPPPWPPAPAASVAVLNLIHERFRRNDFASADIRQYGVLIHQVDFNYPWGWGLPWMPKPANRGPSRGRTHSRFISCSFIFQSMRERRDRKSIPLFSEQGGFVLLAEKTKISCSYGVDGATWNHDCNPKSQMCVSGCGDPPDWCASNGKSWVTSGRGRRLATQETRCFALAKQGQPRPWRPADLGFMLQQYAAHGPPYGARGVGMHSGYNEIVVDGDDWAAAGLPHVIQAFFLLEGATNSAERRVREAHSKFLDAFGLTSANVPLMRLRAENWEEPFELMRPP